MLIITRKLQQAIVIGGNVSIRILSFDEMSVVISIDAPESVEVLGIGVKIEKGKPILISKAHRLAFDVDTIVQFLIKDGRVSIGLDAPRSVEIVREEMVKRNQKPPKNRGETPEGRDE